MEKIGKSDLNLLFRPWNNNFYWDVDSDDTIPFGKTEKANQIFCISDANSEKSDNIPLQYIIRELADAGFRVISTMRNSYSLSFVATANKK
ncbi:MAG: hypothetical protein AB8G05_25980 [Oligoflexales bacterium]